MQTAVLATRATNIQLCIKINQQTHQQYSAPRSIFNAETIEKVKNPTISGTNLIHAGGKLNSEPLLNTKRKKLGLQDSRQTPTLAPPKPPSPTPPPRLPPKPSQAMFLCHVAWHNILGFTFESKLRVVNYYLCDDDVLAFKRF